MGNASGIDNLGAPYVNPNIYTGTDNVMLNIYTGTDNVMLNKVCATLFTCAARLVWQSFWIWFQSHTLIHL